MGRRTTRTIEVDRKDIDAKLEAFGKTRSDLYREVAELRANELGNVDIGDIRHSIEVQLGPALNGRECVSPWLDSLVEKALEGMGCTLSESALEYHESTAGLPRLRQWDYEDWRTLIAGWDGRPESWMGSQDGDLIKEFFLTIRSKNSEREKARLLLLSSFAAIKLGRHGVQRLKKSGLLSLMNDLADSGKEWVNQGQRPLSC